MKTISALFAGIVMAVAALSGCETTRGFGEDVQNTGTHIQQGVEHMNPKEAQQDNQRWQNQTNKTDGETQYGNMSNKTK
ncbi:MAG: hypothetical protein ACM3OC_04665 [Deltaproteobacteria bacterium]